MHTAFLQIAVKILPKRSDNQIARKHLSVMCVPAKVDIHTRCRQRRKLARLMVDDDDRSGLVHILRDLLRRLALADACAGSLRIGAPVQIKAVVEQYTLITQQLNARIGQKRIHLRTARFRRTLPEREACEDRFLDIVIAVAGVHAVF